MGNASRVLICHLSSVICHLIFIYDNCSCREKNDDYCDFFFFSIWYSMTKSELTNLLQVSRTSGYNMYFFFFLIRDFGKFHKDFSERIVVLCET